MSRRLAAALAALSLLLVLASPVAAGGWAKIVPDAAATTEPQEGVVTTFGFTVLQHGITPAPWETPTVHLVDQSTGATIIVVATNDRKDGHFTASVTFPSSGFWTWQVILPDLESDHVPVAVTVLTAAGVAPVYDETASLSAIAIAKQQITDELSNRFYPELERIDAELTLQRSINDRLKSQVAAVTEERDGRVTPAMLTITVLLAILAGAAAGFIMSWLAGRPAPREIDVTFSPAPQGVDPA